MRVVEGRHSGLLCEVLALEQQEEGRSTRARVRLLPSHEAVSVRRSELAERGASRPPSATADERRRPGDVGGREREQWEAERSGWEQRSGQRHGSDDRERRDDRGGGRQREREQYEGEEGDSRADKRQRREERRRSPSDSPPPPAAAAPWLMPHIRVKVVNKRLKARAACLVAVCMCVREGPKRLPDDQGMSSVLPSSGTLRTSAVLV